MPEDEGPFARISQFAVRALLPLLAALVTSLPRVVWADVVFVGDASQPPLSDVLAALRVQVPQEEQHKHEGTLPERAAERVGLARAILARRENASLVLWIAPEDHPFEGRGPYTVTVVRRLPDGGGVEQVPLDLESGDAGARLGALELAELLRTAPGHTPSADTSLAETPTQAPDASRTDTQPASESAQVSADAWQLSWERLSISAGLASRLNWDPTAVQLGPAADLWLELPWSFGVGAGIAWLPPFPRVARDIETSTDELDVLLHLRWLPRREWTGGAQLSGGTRALTVRATASDGFQDSQSRQPLMLSGQLIGAWQPGVWSLLVTAGVDYTPATETFTADRVPVFRTQPWAPAGRLLVERRFE